MIQIGRRSLRCPSTVFNSGFAPAPPFGVPKEESRFCICIIMAVFCSNSAASTTQGFGDTCAQLLRLRLWMTAVDKPPGPADSAALTDR